MSLSRSWRWRIDLNCTSFHLPFVKSSWTKDIRMLTENCYISIKIFCSRLERCWIFRKNSQHATSCKASEYSRLLYYIQKCFAHALKSPRCYALYKATLIYFPDYFRLIRLHSHLRKRVQCKSCLPFSLVIITLRKGYEISDEFYMPISFSSVTY